MATVSEKVQHGYADADEFIQYQLSQARSRIKATDLLTASVLAGLLLVGYILSFTLFDHWVIDGGFGPWTRTCMLVVVLSLCGAILFRYVLRPWFRTIHPLYAARMLDRSSAGLEGSLLALVDLQSGGRDTDSPIQRTLEKRAAVKLAEIHVDEAIDRHLLIRLGTALFALTLITCLYAVFSPKAISLLRPLTLAEASVATRTRVENVQPGNKKVPAGSQIEFIADISGVVPEDIVVLFTTADRRFVDEPLKMRVTDDQNRFEVLMVGEGDRGIRQDLQYRVVAGDATSDVYSITVDQPPTAHVTEVHYKYPAYMNLPERTDSSGTIEAWEDTTVTIRAESSVPLETAVLQLSDDAGFTIRGEELPMSINEKELSVELLLKDREDGSLPKFYRIQVTDADGNSDPDPVVYAMEIRRDQPPVLKLLDPTRDLEVAANAIVPLLVEAEDPDFLLRSVTLHYSINGKPVQPSEVLLDTSKTTLPKRWAESWDFRLAALRLNPGDIVTYHIQARDNRPPLGNQSRTGDLNLKVMAAISDQAVQEQLAQDHEMQQQIKERQAPENNPAEQTEQPAQPNQEPDPSTEPGETPPAAPGEDETEEKKGEKGSNGTDQSKQPGSDPNGERQQQSNENNPRNSETGEESGQDPTAQPQPGSKSSQEQRGKHRADDEEALQKLIEDMNRKRNEDGEDSGDGTDPQSGNRSKSETRPPEPGDRRTSGEESKTRENNDPNSDDKSEGRSETGNADEPNGASREQKESMPNESTDDASTDGKDKTGIQNAETKETADSVNPKMSDPTDSGTDAPKPKNANDGSDTSGAPQKDSKETEPVKSTEDAASSDDPKGKPGTDDQNTDPPTKNDPNSKSSQESQQDDDPSRNKGPRNTQGSKDGNQTEEMKTDGKKTGGEKTAGEKTEGEKPEGEKTDSEMTDGEKTEGEKTAGEKTEGEKTEGEKTDGEKTEGEKSGGEKTDGEKTEGEKSGGEKSGGEKSGGEKSGGEKSGGEKSGGEKSGGEKSGGEKSGGEKSGGEKSGGEKSGGEKSGGEKSGGEKSGGEKSGGEKSGGEKSGGEKSGGEKSGGEKSGGEKSGGEKSGGEKSGGEKSGGEKSDGEEAGGGGESKGDTGESKSGGGAGEGGKGVGKSGKGSSRSGTSAGGGDARGGAGEEGPNFERNADPESPQSENPDVDEKAEAASLALRRLQKDLDRGEPDPELLEKLGWTEDELRAFKDRMLKQLEERQLNEQQLRERSLSEKSFEEMLRSLDVNSTGNTREGRSDNDRDQQDTTNRQSAPPGQWAERFRQYQRSFGTAPSKK